MARGSAILPEALRKTLGGAVLDESSIFVEALARADGTKPRFRAGLPRGHAGQEGLSKIADLPAAPMDVHARTDISDFGALLMDRANEEIQGPDGEAGGALANWKDPHGQQCRFDVAQDLTAKSNFSGLPPPFKRKSEPGGPRAVQIFVAGAGEGKVHVFKGAGSKSEFQKMANCERARHGAGIAHQRGNQRGAGRNAICHLLGKLGGLQIRFPELTTAAKPAMRSTEG
ncbi:unnamed protein product, partial [Prorocentrum cordatum]